MPGRGLGAAIGHRALAPILLTAHGWAATLQTTMAANWIAFGLGQTLVAASGLLPASVIAVMAGAMLGFARGLMLSAGATMLGGWLAFALARSALRGWVAWWLGRHPAMARLDAAMGGEGWRMVALLRVSPVMPFALTSYGIGLTRIAQRDYLIGTLASLPALAGYVAIGALGQQGLLAANAAGPWRAMMLLAGIAVIAVAGLRLRSALGKALTV